MRIALCDDDAQALAGLRAQLDAFGLQRPALDLQVDAFLSAPALLTRVEAGARYAVYLLDVLMPEMTGIELGRRIRRADEFACIAFLTSSKDYALDAFSLSASQYLVKPVSDEDLSAFLDRHFRLFREQPPRTYPLKTHQGVVVLQHSQISFVECRAHKLYVTLITGETLESTANRVSFAKAAQPLFADPDFLQPHKSFLCNMHRIRQMTAEGFVMENGCRVPVAKNSARAVRRKYLDYLAGRAGRAEGED